MMKTLAPNKVAIIILNYNGWKDTIECLESLQKIEYPDYLTIVVDNASSDGSIERIKSWAGENSIFVAEYTKEVAEQGGTYELEEELHKYPNDKKIVLIKNNANLGYSAGNNVGIRYALRKDIDAVLILNPDVRIKNPWTINQMIDVMFSSENVFVVGPNVIDSKGLRESPLKEPSFIQECIFPFVNFIFRALGKGAIGYLESIHSENPFEVKKVAGCCILIRASFLKERGLLDEEVFLYCEESILAEQVRNASGRIFFLPTTVVMHLHKKSPNHLWHEFFKSRRYYMTKYKNYNKIQVSIILLVHKIVSFLR